MEYSEKENIITQLVCGKYLIEIGNRIFIYHEPDSSLLFRAQCHLNKFLKDNRDNGAFLTEEEAKNLAAKEGIWTPEDDARLKQCRSNLEKLTNDKSNYKFRSRELAKIDEYISVTHREIVRLIKRQHTFITQTLDYQSRYDQRCWILAHSLYNADDDRVWVDFDEFEDDSDQLLVNQLVNLIFYQGIFDEKTIREIARSEPWRTRWKTANKTSISLFENDIFGPMQLQVSYWSNMYDAVYESPDCPESDVINDDEALNEWLRDQGNKKSKKDEADADSGIRNTKIRNAQEVFVKVDSAEDARKVYNTLNSPQARNIIRRREEFIAKRGGYAKEQHLPDVQERLRMEINKKYVEHVKRKGK